MGFTTSSTSSLLLESSGSASASANSAGEKLSTEELLIDSKTCIDLDNPGTWIEQVRETSFNRLSRNQLAKLNQTKFQIQKPFLDLFSFLIDRVLTRAENYFAFRASLGEYLNMSNRRGHYELKSEANTQKMRKSCWAAEAEAELATQLCSKVGLLQT